ncbi:MAG: hypothetical protein HZA07_03685, partial [Nitrospirae bacterium]|nr:hypothetical protein [Nitrospirota bacterium]
VKRYADNNGDGTPDTLIDTVPISSINTLWEAGKVLWDRNLSTNPRTIKTTIDGTNMIDFSTTNASTLRPYLRASTDAEASNIINYIKGTDITNYRSRTITISGTSNVWKLGDIVHSTPTTVSKPAENYDLLYKDSTYTTFKQQYARRRHVVYAGANDGMLHAFNAGFFDSANHKFWRNYSGGTYSDTGPLLGEELFAFIPQSLLPHLKWLTDTNYTHVYYVDLKPKVVDVRIFTQDSTHPNGWGTVLIGGMRFGGKEICVSDTAFTGGSQTFYSAYFALDITNPEDSVSYGKLLWTFTHTDLALTTSYPAVLRTGLRDQAGTWHVVFGSGPTAYDGSSTKAGNIFVVNLSTGALAREFTDSALMTRAFMADTMTVDVNMDYQVDVIYIGNTYCDSASGCTSSTWKGKMYRIDTSGNDSTPSTDPGNWVLTTFYDPGQPVTSAPAAALDDLSNLWIFFGTGRFLSTDDKSFGTTDKWSFYGIKDLCKPWMNTVICTQMPLTDYPLFDASNVVVSTDQTVTGAEAGAGGTFSGMVNLINSYRGGWYVNFATAGERSLFKPLVLGGLVIWTTYIPSTDLCAFEGSGRLYATYYKTGTAYYQYVFEQTGTTVLRDISLGTGVPSSPAATVTGESTIMGFVQQSSGAIVQIEQTTPSAVKSGFAGWKQEIIP